MTDTTENNVISFKAAIKAKNASDEHQYAKDLKGFRERLFDLLEGYTRARPLGVLDFAQTLIDGATYTSLLALDGNNELERRARMVIAEARLALAKIQDRMVD